MKIDKKCLEDELRVIKNKIRNVSDEEKKALLSFRRMAKALLQDQKVNNEKT